MMEKRTTILVLEDEPLILLDLEFAAEDSGCEMVSTSTVEAALAILSDRSTEIDVAILDVSLGHGKTCFPVAAELDRLQIPYILHTGDLNRHDERVRELNAPLIAKPAATDAVIAAAIASIKKGEAADASV